MAKRADLEASISKFAASIKNINYNDNNQGLSTLEYLYQSYIFLLKIPIYQDDFLEMLNEVNLIHFPMGNLLYTILAG